MNTQLRHWRRHLHTTMRTAGSGSVAPSRSWPPPPAPAVPSRARHSPRAGTASRRAVRARPRGTATITRVITTGGMPGWQIALIALGAALVAATAAVILDRTLARRRPAPP